MSYQFKQTFDTDMFKPISIPLLFSLSFLCFMYACLEGGSNQNEKQAGNQDDGINVGMGDIAIHPAGKYFLSKHDNQLILGTIDNQKAEKLEGIENPQRLLFANTTNTVFITTRFNTKKNSSDNDDNVAGLEETGEIISYNLETKQKLWSASILNSIAVHSTGIVATPVIKLSSDDSKIFLVYDTSLKVISAQDGSLLNEQIFTNNIYDLDLIKDRDEAIITLEHEWDAENPRTQIVSLEMTKQSTTTVLTSISVENCSSELIISFDSHYAFLAPDGCQKDPVSVIDLKEKKWMRNLPGFGPVTLSPNGNTAIAFIDSENIDETLFDSKDDIPSSENGQYHIMFIDTQTLKFETIPIGDTLPRYTITPDGNILLVDASTFFEDGQVRIIDVYTKKITKIAGPDIRLENYVITSDSSQIFLLQKGLFHLDISEALAESVALKFIPTNINITPNDTHLLLRENDTTIWIYNIDNEKVIHSIKL